MKRRASFGSTETSHFRRWLAYGVGVFGAIKRRLSSMRSLPLAALGRITLESFDSVLSWACLGTNEVSFANWLLRGISSQITCAANREYIEPIFTAEFAVQIDNSSAAKCIRGTGQIRTTATVRFFIVNAKIPICHVYVTIVYREYEQRLIQADCRNQNKNIRGIFVSAYE